MGHLPHSGQRRQVRHVPLLPLPSHRTQLTRPVLASLRCIQVIAGVLGRAGEAGQKQRLAAAARGDITYRPATGLVVQGSEEDVRAARAKQDAEIAEALAASRGKGMVSDAEVDADAELARHMDDVDNREDHRQKGGRRLKFSD